MSGSVAVGIERIIKDHGLIQRMVAEKAGFTQQQFSDMLCGRKIIRADYMVPIANAMRVSVQDIYDAGADYKNEEAV